jgi:transposase
MSIRIHPQARTTPKIRQEIKDSGLSDREVAKVFNVSRETAAKWLKRDDVQDRSHRAHTLHTTLSAPQEAIVLSLRQSLYLPLDDLLYVTRQYINADVSRAGLARMLKPRHFSYPVIECLNWGLVIQRSLWTVVVVNLDVVAQNEFD